MSNIPFLAEEGNVIEGLHFDYYLGWGGGSGAEVCVWPHIILYVFNINICKDSQKRVSARALLISQPPQDTIKGLHPIAADCCAWLSHKTA